MNVNLNANGITEKCPVNGAKCINTKIECISCEVYRNAHKRYEPTQPTVSTAVTKELTLDEVFAKYEPMTEYMAIYIPSTCYNKPVSKDVIDAVVDTISEQFSTIFGGTTVINGNGGYLADNGEYISEPVTIVKSFTSKIEAKMAEKVLVMAKWIKIVFEQEAVSVEYNGKLILV